MTLRLPARSLAIRATPSGRIVLNSPDRPTREFTHEFVEWGSVTKVLTAQAIASLRADGLISYDTVLGDVLPSSRADDRLLTDVVAHVAGLCPMHSGAPRGILGDPCAPFDSLWPVAHLLERVGEIRPAGEYTYSNLGYALLGSVVERVTRRSWVDVVTSRVLCESSDATLKPDKDRRCLPRDLRHQFREPWGLSTGNYAPAGGMWSTVEGLLDFGRDQLNSGFAFARGSGWARLGEFVRGANGRTRDTDLSVVLDMNSESVTLVHSIRTRPGSSWRTAQRLAGYLA